MVACPSTVPGKSGSAGDLHRGSFRPRRAELHRPARRRTLPRASQRERGTWRSAAWCARRVATSPYAIVPYPPPGQAFRADVSGQNRRGFPRRWWRVLWSDVRGMTAASSTGVRRGVIAGNATIGAGSSKICPTWGRACSVRRRRLAADRARSQGTWGRGARFSRATGNPAPFSCCSRRVPPSFDIAPAFGRDRRRRVAARDVAVAQDPDYRSRW